MTIEHAIIIWLYIAGGFATRQILTAFVVKTGKLPPNKWVEPLTVAFWPIFIPIMAVMAVTP